MLRTLVAACLVVVVSACSEKGSESGSLEGAAVMPVVGAWLGELETQNGWLPFNMEIARDGEAWSAVIINGTERIEVADVRMDGGEFVIGFPHYDSEIRASVGENGHSLDGTWTKVRGVDNVAEVVFRGKAGELARFEPSTQRTARADDLQSLNASFGVRFKDSQDLARMVLRLEDAAGSTNLQGTVLTPTGDYRYLSGLAEANRIRISCFDGAHAFLFDAGVMLRTMEGTQLYDGVFDSGNWYSVEWDTLWGLGDGLPDAFEETSWNDEADLSQVVFRDLDGNSVRLTDAEFVGKPTLIKVTGTWCPNCNDAAPFLADIHRRYRDDGLQVVALAFELTEDFERSATQVRRFIERHGIEFPVLIAGLSDKDRASEFLPVLDRVRSYPTTIFMNADGTVRAIHTGFTGPATGEAYLEMKAEFERLIGEMLE